MQPRKNGRYGNFSTAPADHPTQGQPFHSPPWKALCINVAGSSELWFHAVWQSFCKRWSVAFLLRPSDRGRQRHRCDFRERRPTRATSHGVCRVHRDSTFRVVPSLFHQLFTIFAPQAEHTFPVCFALVSRKTIALYEVVFRQVHELVRWCRSSKLPTIANHR